MGMWKTRVARTEEGQLIFVYARYASGDDTERRGMVIAAKPIGGTKDIKELRNFAHQLLRACEEPIISTREYAFEDENGNELKKERTNE